LPGAKRLPKLAFCELSSEFYSLAINFRRSLRCRVLKRNVKLLWYFISHITPFRVNSWSIFLILFFFLALQPSVGYGLPLSRGFLITHNDALQSVGLLWTSDQLVAENCTW
jgi:hypothetical protein